MSLDDLLRGEDVESIAKRMLGAVISTNINGYFTSAMIVETEAYKAPEDKGSHAFGNKRTQRTETLFAKAGTSYVYLCYGLHHLVNIVTGPENIAHAVLLRAVQPIKGNDVMLRRRRLSRLNYNLTNGPGKLSQALGITTSYDGHNFLSEQSKIRLTKTNKIIDHKDVICSPRVGIAYAAECAHWPWRFRLKDNPWTSLPRNVSYV